MGSAKKTRKHYAGPRHPYSRERIEEEMRIAGEYGLRNKKEIWKVKTKLRRYRQRARNMLALSDEIRVDQEALLINKLLNLGVIKEGATLDDILALTPQSFLDRRLQTVVFKRGLASTPHQARQFIVHGHICIQDRKVTIPAYHIKKIEEDLISYTNRSPIVDEEHPARQAMKELLSRPKPTVEFEERPHRGGDRRRRRRS